MVRWQIGIYLVLQLPKFCLFLLLRITLRAGTGCAAAVRAASRALAGDMVGPQEKDHDLLLGPVALARGLDTGRQQELLSLGKTPDCEGRKAQGFLSSGALPGGTSSSCFCVTAP